MDFSNFSDVCITILGTSSICIENYKGILEYTCESLVILTKSMKITITGKNLSISYYSSEEMNVTGIISQICFEK